MLIRRIEKFLRQTGMPSSTFGRKAAQDPCFVADLRNGRTPRGVTEARVEQFMAAYLETANAN